MYCGLNRNPRWPTRGEEQVKKFSVVVCLRLFAGKQGVICNTEIAMCGIFCSIHEENESCKRKIEIIRQSVIPLLQKRGPDYSGTTERTISSGIPEKSYLLTLTGTVLHLRGSLTPQPCEDQHGNILVWNGEIFNGIKIPEGHNDTSALCKLLGNHDNTKPTHHVIDIMSRIQGPWSFVYWQTRQRRLWFGRDYFGRRSLLWHLPLHEGDPLLISSVAERANGPEHDTVLWKEVPADGIYYLEIAPEESASQSPYKITRFSWKECNMQGDSSMTNTDAHCELKSPVAEFNSMLPSESDLEHLDTEIKVPPQSVSIYATKHNVMSTDRPKITSESFERTSDFFDTSDVCMTKEKNPSNGNLTEEKSMMSDTKEKLSRNCSIDCHETESHPSTSPTTSMDSSIRDTQSSCSKETFQGCTHLETHMAECQHDSNLAKEFATVLGEAVRKRVFNLPRNLDDELLALHLDEKRKPASEELIAKHGVSRVGVLFSGGIDSIMLAALADKFVPEHESMDLINVAFEQKPTKDNPNNRKSRKSNRGNCDGPKKSNFDVPDRLTGRSGLQELAAINPRRQWNFVEVNVTLEELQEARSKYISHLVSPLNSVLDDSIGCALWFAARGSGVLRCPSCIGNSVDDVTSCTHVTEYTSNAKVLLVGMGADEQLGGYARHRTKFNQNGWAGLIQEIEMEVARISARNLGRDDRCISDHGREARFPFLDENVVSFLNRLPVWLKTDPRRPRGAGEKFLLRQAARLLGLTSSSALPKRAIQFGSRIAKLESSNEKGSETCTRFSRVEQDSATI